MFIDTTAENLAKLDAKPWGDRYYINQWWTLIDDLGSAGQGGWGPRSNADFQRLEASKCWVGSDGELHLDKLQERGRIDKAILMARLEQAIAAILG